MQMPRYARNYVAQQASPSAGVGEQVVSNVFNNISQIATKFANVQDSTTANAELSQFKLDTDTKLNELSVEFGDNPDEFKKRAEEYLNTSTLDLSTNTKVSGLNIANYNEMLASTKTGFQDAINNNYRKIQVSKFRTDLDKTVENNNILAYRTGLQGDFETFEKELVKNNANLLITGKNIYSKNELQAVQANAMQSNYMNYFTGQLASNPQLTREMLDSGEFDEKLGIDNVKSLYSVTDKILEQQERQYQLGLSEQEKINLNQNIFDIENSFNMIGTDKEAKNLFNINKQSTSVNLLGDIKKKIEQAKQQGLSEKEYNKYYIKLNGYYRQIAKSVKDSDPYKTFWNTSVLADAVEYIDGSIPESRIYNRDELYGQAMSELVNAGYDLNSKDTDAKTNARKIVNDLVDYYYEIPANTPNRMEVIKYKQQKIKEKETQSLLLSTKDYRVKQITDGNIDLINIIESSKVKGYGDITKHRSNK